MADAHHFESLKYANFHTLNGYQWQSACSCKISSRSVKRCRRYSGILFPIWRPSVILNFWKMQILTFCTVYDDNLHIPAKYRLDLLNGCEYIANLPFSVWRSPAILNLWNMQILTPRTVYSQNLPIYTKFDHDPLNGSGDIVLCLISNMATVRHFEFLRYANFHFLHDLRWQSANFVSICSKVAEILQIFHFQYGSRPPFWICEICKF